MTTALEATGWNVLRLWDFEVERDLAGCVEQVVEALRGSGSAIRDER